MKWIVLALGFICGLTIVATPSEGADVIRGPLPTLSLWKGEKYAVWRDVTNRTPSLVVMKPSSPDRFVQTGVAMPVRREKDVLVNDRVVWGGSVAVPPGGVAKVVAEITAADETCTRARIVCGDETFDYPMDVVSRTFPQAKERRTFLDIWQHPWAVARINQVKPFSKAHYDRMRPLWTELAEAGQKVITTTIMDQPWAHQCFDAYGTMVRHVKLKKGGWRFDYSVFDEYVAFAKSCGLGPQIHCYSLCPFRLKRYSWEDEEGHVFSGDFDVGSAEFVDYWTDFLNDFARHLKAKGWFDDVYIALDERSPAELDAAVRLVKANGAFRIALAADRPPSQFSGMDVDNFSIALQCVTEKYIAETRERRKLGKTTTFYTAGSNPCTSLRNPPEHVQWLGAYSGVVDLDGYLRWAFCSWPANPDSDAVYSPWFGGWDKAGGTYLYYPKGPSLRYLGLCNGINLSEKLHLLRAEGKIDGELASLLKECRYPVGKDFPDKDVVAALLRRIAAAVNACERRSAK